MFRKMPWDSWRNTAVAVNNYTVAGPIHPVLQPAAMPENSTGVLETSIRVEKPTIVFRLEDAAGAAALSNWQVILHLQQTNVSGQICPDTTYDLTGKMLLGRGSVTLDVSDFGASVVSFHAFNRDATGVTRNCSVRVEVFGCFSENENKLPADTQLPVITNPSMFDWPENPATADDIFGGQVDA